MVGLLSLVVGACGRPPDRPVVETLIMNIGVEDSDVGGQSDMLVTQISCQLALADEMLAPTQQHGTRAKARPHNARARMT